MVEAKTKVKRYDTYKNSSVEWLGEIPEHWEVLANKHIFSLKKNQVGKKSDDYDLLSLTLKGVVVRNLENGGKFPAEFDTYQEVKKGDFVFCLFDVEETPRCVGLSDFDGMITGAYTVMEPNENFDKRFLYHYYLNLDADKRMKPLYTGLRNTISKDNFFAFKTFVPPLKEQTKIAEFLDDKATKIEDAIAIKEQQINLLKEHKQILIHKAVTQGLNPNVTLKDSGVEWIGEIPKGWVMSRLGLMLTPYSVKNYPKESLLSITRELGIIERNLEDTESNHNFIPEDLSGYKLIEKGDFGMNKMKAWQGSYGVSKFRGIISPAYYTFKLVGTINPDFFHLAIRSKIYVPFFGQASDGVRIGQWDLSKDRMKMIPFVIPTLKEQKEILDYIDVTSKKIKTAINLKLQEIAKLKEYKSSLINSVVTGKVKVC